ncbi:MAG: HlyD family efflux transporter periplasmic adaptor subunit [Moraxellaceae bacterium]|nr:HlyD family efflux transporter periplasmic adaptor subunit [Moraxellaceae bacterium]
MSSKKNTQRLFVIGSILFVSAILLYAFWPRAIAVDIAQVKTEPMQLTISEEGKTQVHQAYVVSAPITGQLLRVEVEAGDKVIKNQSILFKMQPTSLPLLDKKATQQAQANLNMAQAALNVAQTELEKAHSDKALAQKEAQRAAVLYQKQLISQAEYDRLKTLLSIQAANIKTALAMITMRQADVANAKTGLIGFNATSNTSKNHIMVTSPLTGQILQIQQKSENYLVAGTPIITIGDTSNDLEVLVELLSTDAVKVAVGNPVTISNWGGNNDLHGTIAKIEPFAFTKYSALGVEEQRVNVLVKFSDSADKYQKLGQGFRVEAHIIVWQDDHALVVPSGSLFRVNNKWAVFKIHKGIAQLTSVNVGYNNGTQAQILSGLKTGEQVVLYPTPQLVDGVNVVQR